jgi:hypothetical protein
MMDQEGNGRALIIKTLCSQKSLNERKSEAETAYPGQDMIQHRKIATATAFEARGKMQRCHILDQGSEAQTRLPSKWPTIVAKKRKTIKKTVLFCFLLYCYSLHCCFFELCSLLFNAAPVCSLFGGADLATIGNQPKLQLL